MISNERIQQLNRIAAYYWTGPIFFALMTAIGAQIQYLVFEIPFTLQTVAVYSSGLFLGAKRGALAQVLYLFGGLFLPVFAGHNAGLQYLYGEPSSGFLLGFPAAAWVVGMVNKKRARWLLSWLSLELGSLILFAIGVTWLYLYLDSWTLVEAIQNGWLKYAPVDQLKIILVLLIYMTYPRPGNSSQQEKSRDTQRL